MRNEPNFQKVKRVVTQVLTRNYNEKLTMDSWSKRTQTNPILSAEALAKADKPASMSEARRALFQTADKRYSSSGKQEDVFLLKRTAIAVKILLKT